MEDVPGITQAADGIPGDPVNVSLIGSETELKRILVAAGWFPADPLTLRSCLEIAEASVLKRSYDDAPVSSLYLFGRKEDLAFEQPRWETVPGIVITCVSGVPTSSATTGGPSGLARPSKTSGSA